MLGCDDWEIQSHSHAFVGGRCPLEMARANADFMTNVSTSRVRRGCLPGLGRYGSAGKQRYPGLLAVLVEGGMYRSLWNPSTADPP